MLNGKLIYLAYLAIAGVVGLGGYYIVPQVLDRNEPAVIGEQKPAESDATSGKSDRVTAETPAVSQETLPEEVDVAKADPQEAAPDMTAEPVVPTFDIVRVEPDGSLVVAGTGEANGKIEVLSGEATIATADAGPSGDFVSVLDEPLAPGDYQLQLRSIAPDGTATLSEEIATVSIPHGASDQLLAMVGKPGEASRILTQPTPEKEAPAQEVASADPAAASAIDIAENGETPSTPDLPAGSAELSGSAPMVAVAEADQPATDAGPDMSADTETDTNTDMGKAAPEATETAALAPDAAETATESAEEPASQPAIEYSIRVDAVEIEDSTIYVAGAATPGLQVRVLADDAPIGSTKADAGGRFIVEAPVELSVGEHQIAAELLAPGGDEVAMRAVVPFNRPEANRMAAVAPASAPEDGAGTVAEPASSASNTVEQDRLTPASGSVIIRKGDTLWEISRRTYGQGVRYTTIYLANQQQIADPNMISPGQVFNVPEKWDENAEKTHHDLLEKRRHSTN